MAFTYTKRKDGRLMKRVSVNGKLKTIYSNNVKDLEEKYIELKHLSINGLYLDDNNINIKDWTIKWFNTYKVDKSKATQKMYLDAINLYIIPELGFIKLNKLKEADILNLLNKLISKPRQKEIVLLTINQILEKAVDNDLINKNIARKIKIKKHKSAEKKPLTNLEISYLKKVSEHAGAGAQG